MIDLRPVAYVIGRILVVLAILMVAPAIIDWRGNDMNWAAFAQSAVITGTVGATLSMATANGLSRSLEVRQAYLLTVGIWAFVPAFAALPFWLGAPGLSPVYAYFEGVSGITTTGASVITGLADMPQGVNLWRGMMNWVGGLGIAFIAMIFLPIMRVGGMQFFRTEGFDTFGKALPRATDIARQLLVLYCGLTVAVMLAYAALGMGTLDAVVHGMASVATGGFSTRDASFSGFSAAIHYVAVLAMLIASLPFLRYAQLMAGYPMPLWRDIQVRAFLSWLLIATLMLAAWRVWTSAMPVEEAFRESLFNLASIMTTTGFGSGSFPSWGGEMLVIAFTLGMVGGCSGSTSSGLTVFRIQIAMAVLRRQIRQITNPSAVDPVKYDGRTVEEDVISALIMFISGFIVILGVLSVAMTLTGVDIESALFGVWSTLGNVGYAFGPLTARTGSFIDYPEPAVLIMTLAMIMGRLGLTAVLILLLPRFWRR